MCDSRYNRFPFIDLFLYSGWVCYAEKTHGSFILPYISSTKSPQQIMGSLVKQHLARSRDLAPDSVYHVTLMPCYDKKLEASREDFYSDLLSCHDVDCVITASEFKKKRIFKSGHVLFFLG